MDHFLSGLEPHHASPWYSSRTALHHPQAHEFAVGPNSFQLIPIAGSGMMSGNSTSNSSPNNGQSPDGAINIIGNACTSAGPSDLSHGAPSGLHIAKLKLDIKQELDDRPLSPGDGIPMGHNIKRTPRKGKNGDRWDTKKICNLCGKVLSRGDKLKNHMRIHTNNFPHHCDVCGQGFLRSEGLRVHNRIHTGERPYVCLICGKSYTRKDKLTRHAIVHTGERPFVCGYCGKSFTRKDKMQRHELIHKVEKPFTCVPCNLEFGRQEAFNAHMERKHPERLPYTIVTQSKPAELACSVLRQSAASSGNHTTSSHASASPLSLTSSNAPAGVTTTSAALSLAHNTALSLASTSTPLALTSNQLPLPLTSHGGPLSLAGNANLSLSGNSTPLSLRANSTPLPLTSSSAPLSLTTHSTSLVANATSLMAANLKQAALSSRLSNSGLLQLPQ